MEVMDDVKRIIAKALKVPVDQLTPETPLEDIGAQSLDVIEIIFELEERFNINIPVAEGNADVHLESYTVGEMARVVRQLMDAQKPS